MVFKIVAMPEITNSIVNSKALLVTNLKSSYKDTIVRIMCSDRNFTITTKVKNRVNISMSLKAKCLDNFSNVNVNFAYKFSSRIKGMCQCYSLS